MTIQEISPNPCRQRKRHKSNAYLYDEDFALPLGLSDE